LQTKKLLSGNEAIALAAYEAGATVGAGYPGTPSTEILESLTKYPGVYTEWSVNEKVAFEVAIGASLAGARTLVTMKHVGLNVASDPLFTASYIGVGGGLVVVNADDPEMHSSQNEQDNRHYAFAAKVPMLEPADCQEAKDFTVEAFRMSEKYDTPVIVRMVTRLSHSLGIVAAGTPNRERKVDGFRRNIKKYVMIPANARGRHVEVEKRMALLKKDANKSSLNKIEIRDTDIGFISAGVCYNYLREAFPEASVLKLGTINPLPEELIREFADKVKKLFIVEELDPYIEMRVKAYGIPCVGKALFPLTGELNPDIIRKPFFSSKTIQSKQNSSNISKAISASTQVPPRPPSLCPGCPHRTVFNLLNKKGLTVAGDIGCYTLGVLPPFNAMDTCVEMGGSIGVAQGIEIAEGEAKAPHTVAVIGDSTFAHSGITGLLNAAYNKRHSLIIVLDNGTTAMTGIQPNPLSGERINHEETVALDYRHLGLACGLAEENIVIVNAYKPAEVEAAIDTLINSKKLSLLVVKGPCIILKKRKKA
jgi:indolepyruvate ferredoxin oxidoreductase, alpha subunit